MALTALPVDAVAAAAVAPATTDNIYSISGTSSVSSTTLYTCPEGKTASIGVLYWQATSTNYLRIDLWDSMWSTSTHFARANYDYNDKNHHWDHQVTANTSNQPWNSNWSDRGGGEWSKRTTNYYRQRHMPIQMLQHVTYDISASNNWHLVYKIHEENALT